MPVPPIALTPPIVCLSMATESLVILFMSSSKTWLVHPGREAAVMKAAIAARRIGEMTFEYFIVSLAGRMSGDLAALSSLFCGTGAGGIAGRGWSVFLQSWSGIPQHDNALSPAKTKRPTGEPTWRAPQYP